MGTMTIAFRIADDQDYQAKRNRLHHFILSVFSRDNVFDEMTSVYVVQSALSAPTLAAHLGKAAGLTERDKLLVLECHTTQPGTYGGFADLAKLFRILSFRQLGNILAQMLTETGSNRRG